MNIDLALARQFGLSEAEYGKVLAIQGRPPSLTELGIFSENLRVLGLMPHPEDLVDPLMGGVDGKPLFDSLTEVLAA